MGAILTYHQQQQRNLGNWHGLICHPQNYPNKSSSGVNVTKTILLLKKTNRHTNLQKNLGEIHFETKCAIQCDHKNKKCLKITIFISKFFLKLNGWHCPASTPANLKSVAPYTITQH